MPWQSTAKSKKGFTLVELMVAISIVAILSAIGLTVYTQAQRSGRDSKRQGDIQEIQKALEQYYALNKVYPLANNNPTTLATAIGGNFASGSIPTGPKTSEVYFYTPCGSNDQYTLCTAAAAMETCTTSNRNCNATAAGSGCVPYTTGSPNTLYCVRSLSN